MFALVITIDASLDHTPLTYAIPKHLSSLRRGNIVSVPFRDELLHAVVVDIVANAEGISEDEIKPIVSIDVNREVLSSYQLEAVLCAAKEFFLHAHKALSLFLSAPYLRQALKKWGNTGECPDSLSPWDSGHPIELITPKEGAGAMDYLKWLFEKGESALVVFPFEKDAQSVYKSLPEEIRTGTLFVNEDIPEVREFRAKEDILSGKFRFVFGSRRILLYNAAAYSHIVYLEDSLAKTFVRSFHTLPYIFFLESFAKSGKRITVFSQFPQVSDFLAVKRGDWTFTQFP